MFRLLRIVTVLFLAAALLVIPAGCAAPKGGPSGGQVEPPPPPPPPPKAKSPITGLEYDSSVPLTAVMIENHKDARPQSGLLSADLVYEAQAEGGITRFMAIYHSQDASLLGPVRSARPYFVQWAREWGAAYAHCGGSEEGLAAIRRLGLIDLDDMSGSGFWRDNSRKSPHNLYTSMASLTERIGARKPAEPTARWQFGPWADQPSKGLTIDYGYKYTVAYDYKDHAYQRSMNGVPHTDRETKQVIAPANIIVQFVKSKVIDSELRLKMDTVGEGKAIFLVAGRYSEGTWSKADETSPTRFVTADGKGLTLATGQTWIEVVPVTAAVAEKK
ncbi:MAG: DUF3048 domain-containing protein [Chloroflexota bacterium]